MDDDLPQPDDPCPGAAEALFSSEPLIVAARKLIESGRFSDARARLDLAPTKLAEELCEIISRIEVAYRTTPEQLLAKLESTIPNVTSEDLKRWTAAGEVQFREIDSQLLYFNREPANLFRFCAEAKRRRAGLLPNRKRNLHAHLRQIIEAAERSDDSLLVPVDHEVQYTITIAPSALGLKRGAPVRAWLPFPRELAQQTNVRLIDASPAGYQLSPPSSPQRAIYFETHVCDDAPTFNVTFSFRSFARYPRLDDQTAEQLPVGFPAGWLAERPPHIRFTSRALAAVREAIGDENNPLRKARRIYDSVVRNIAYAAEEEYCTLSGLSEKALQSRRGDCGVMTMLFITMCRIAGIPARWQSGFQTLPDEHDMHDWAEFYVAPFGWLPADLSYGYQPCDEPVDARIHDFYFGHLDSYRLVVNRDFGRQLSPRKSLLRSEPLDFQRGEIELADRNLYFPHWSWNMTPRTNFL